MNEYVFSSKLFTGSMHFGYDEEGILNKFLNYAQLNDKQLQYLTGNFPFVESDLQKLVGSSGKIEQVVDVSFEKFWTMYAKKVNKKRCESLWYARTEDERQLCLSKIPKYLNYCKLNRRIVKDPDTYLRNQSWVDEL